MNTIRVGAIAFSCWVGCLSVAAQTPISVGVATAITSLDAEADADPFVTLSLIGSIEARRGLGASGALVVGADLGVGLGFGSPDTEHYVYSSFSAICSSRSTGEHVDSGRCGSQLVVPVAVSLSTGYELPTRFPLGIGASARLGQRPKPDGPGLSAVIRPAALVWAGVPVGVIGGLDLAFIGRALVGPDLVELRVGWSVRL